MKNERIARLLKVKKQLFHIDELASLWSIDDDNLLRVTLSRYVKKGILNRVYRGFYVVQDLENIDPVKLGQKSYHAYCYLSTESVLVTEGLISQKINYITLIGSRPKRFKIGSNSYYVRQLKNEFLYNDIGIDQKNGIFLASRERAVADLLYFNPNYYLDGMNSNLIDWNKVKDIQQQIGY
ncbi:MAG: hypothetical protein GF335_00450 [Candidatus Moranbacteria bacterium]|nr:hypothetical protein [Candidatus Moranbacteria bacterium]